MTRIIGGEDRGRRIRTPSGANTRPTSDRVREALFSALESEFGSLHRLAFLDLYAGSGAVALEAASRGASVVIAVESDRRTARLVESNAEALDSVVEVVARPVGVYLAGRPPTRFDIVFADPPYPMPSEEAGEMLRLLVENEWLSPGATVVLERSARSVEPAWPLGLGGPRSKRYGETVLWYVRRASPTEQEIRQE